MLKRNISRIVVMIVLHGLLPCRSALASLSLALPAEPQVAQSKPMALDRPHYPAPGADEFAANVRSMCQRYQAVDFDPAVRAAALGDGVEPVFQFVRDQIRVESYVGAFRGAAGAYRNRAANAADRSLLLAEMLKQKKIATRFARGRLSRENAEALIARMFDARASSDAPAAPSGSAQSSEMLRRIHDRATRDYSVVRSALGDSMPSAASPSHDELVNELTPHVWVQANVDGQWVDLDPSFADATVGKRYCDAEQTSPALGDDLYQRATIRLISEKLEGGALKSETVLEFQQPACNLADRQIFLVHSPPSGMRSLGRSMSGQSNDTWTPMLWIDGDVTVGKQIVYREGKAAEAKSAAGGLGGAIDALSGGDPPASSGDASPQFVAEWLEFQITYPGGRTETTRRSLCDRAGAALRRATTALDPNALQPLMRNEAGPVAAQTVHQLWFSAGCHDLAEYSHNLQQLVDAMRPAAAGSTTASTAAAAEQDDDFAQQIWPLVLKNATCVMATDHTILPALNDDPANVRCYLDSPRIVVFSTCALPVAGKSDSFTLQSEIDLRRDFVRTVARTPSQLPGAANRRIWYGLLEGSLEHELAAREATVMDPSADAMSTSALLDESGVALLRASDPAASQWEQLASSKEAAARLAGDLSSGEFVVVPKRVTQGAGDMIGYWAISSKTGDTRAVFDAGLHGSVWKGPDGGRTGGGSSGASVNHVDPKTGNAKNPKGSKGPKGDEYMTIVANISLPGGYELSISITPRLLSVTIEVTKLLL